MLFLISENITFRLPIHVRPDAFGSHSRGDPPRTGTVHMSHLKPASSTVVYAIRDPSGEKTGLIFDSESPVS
jgi:hypothetical protein